MGILKNLAQQAQDMGRKVTVRQLMLRQGSNTNLAALVQAVENERNAMKKREKKTAKRATPKVKKRKGNSGHQSTTKPKPSRKKTQPYKTLRQRTQALAMAMMNGNNRRARCPWEKVEELWNRLAGLGPYLMKMSTKEFQALLRRQNAAKLFHMFTRIGLLGEFIAKATDHRVQVPQAVCDQAAQSSGHTSSGQP